MLDAWIGGLISTRPPNVFALFGLNPVAGPPNAKALGQGLNLEKRCRPSLQAEEDAPDAWRDDLTLDSDEDVNRDARDPSFCTWSFVVFCNFCSSSFFRWWIAMKTRRLRGRLGQLMLSQLRLRRIQTKDQREQTRLTMTTSFGQIDACDGLQGRPSPSMARRSCKGTRRSGELSTRELF